MNQLNGLTLSLFYTDDDGGGAVSIHLFIVEIQTGMWKIMLYTHCCETQLQSDRLSLQIVFLTGLFRPASLLCGREGCLK